MYIIKLIILAISLWKCSSQMVEINIGILHDHYVSSQHIDAVYESVIKFPEMFNFKDDVDVVAKRFDLDNGLVVYDEIKAENFTALIVVAKKLKCDQIVDLKKQVPIYVISGSFESCDEYEKSNSIIYLYPPDTFVLSSMLLATKQYQWKNAIVLGEKNDEFSFTFTSMQQARVENLDTIAFDAVVERNALRETLLSAKKAGIRAFIVMAQFDHVQLILSIAEELELTDKNFHWFLPNAFVIPTSLKSFINEEIKISLLYSPLLTPLIEKILNKENGNLTEINLMSEVASSLTFLSLKQILNACVIAKAENCLNLENEKYICRTNLSDISEVSPVSTAMQGHATSSSPSTHGHTTSSTASMQGHTTTSTASMHGHTTTSTASMHGHTTTSTASVHGHTTSSTASMQGHTTSSTASMQGHTTTSKASMHGHTTTSTPSMQMLTTTTTHAPMSQLTTTTIPSMQGHMSISTSSIPMHTTTLSIISDPTMHGAMSTTTSGVHTPSTTSSMASSHTTTTIGMAGHTTITTPVVSPSKSPAVDMSNAHTTITTSMLGHMSTSTTSSAQMHNMLSSATESLTPVMHGHMKRSVQSTELEKDSCKTCHHTNYIHSSCHRKSCTTPSRQRIKIEVGKQYNFPEVSYKHEIGKRSVENIDSVSNPACLTYTWEDNIVDAAVQIVNVSSFENKGVGANTDSIASDVGTISATFDSCVISSTYNWNYKNDSCSKLFVENTEISSANLLFVVEYISENFLSNEHARSRNKDRQPVVVGVYNSRSRSYIKVQYDPLHISDVFLPSRDLLVGAIFHSPWLTWRVDEETGEKQFEGYLYEILERLSTSMNFSYQLMTEYNYPLDVHDDDAIEDYMLNVFNNNSVDFFLHAKSVRGNRLGKSNKVLLSAAFQQPHMFLLTKRVEKTESVSIWQFMLPFREESWILFWSTFILISLLMAYINKKNPNEYQAISHTFGPNSSPSDHLGILNSLWFTFAAICGQGADIVPRSTACVMLTGTWWGFVLLVLSAYTANMTAFMTQVNSGGIETLDELASQQQFAYGMIENNAMLDLFLPGAKDAPYTTMFEYLHKFENESILEKQEDGFTKVLNGNYYLLASFEAVVDALAQSCDFDVVGTGFYQYQFALPFPQGSVYINMFNDHIKKLADKGVLAALEQEWFTLEKKCETEAVEKNLENQLDIKAFTGMYVFLIIGVASGMLISAVETGWIKFGGLGGLFNRAGIYELEANRKELQKANELFEKEFESWEGGWDVWKFKEWKDRSEPIQMMPVTAKPSRRTSPCAMKKCNVCGRKITENIAKTPEVTKPQVVEIPQLPKLKAQDDDLCSNDSGRESASSGQLTITEKSDTQVSDISPTPDRNHEIHLSDINEPTIYKNLPLATEQATVSVPTPSRQISQNIIVTADLHQPKYPLEMSSSAIDNRLETALSSTISHSSLASGTISFISDSEESVSIIHRRTPYHDSRSPSRYAESEHTFDLETPSSFYTTTSFGTNMESAYSRVSTWTYSSDFTCDSRIDECTEEDTHSDVTVINRSSHYR